MIYLQLFLQFFRIGLFSIGGGMATIPFLTQLSETTGWYSLETLADMIAVSESTPGPIGVNMASYVGVTVGGVGGLLCAVAGLIMPSILIILLIARALERFRDNQWVNGIFRALRPMSVALIFAAGISVARIALMPAQGVSWVALAIALVSFIGASWKKTKKVHPIGWIILGGGLGAMLL